MSRHAKMPLIPLFALVYLAISLALFAFGREPGAAMMQAPTVVPVLDLVEPNRC